MLRTIGALGSRAMANIQYLANGALVSAVIPTRGRPQLLASAVRSVLRQTWRHIEVIVVFDGPDPESEALLATITDRRLRSIVMPETCGGSMARNAGVRAARGEWIAFLDDDDEWLPEKIARQMAAVEDTSAWFPVITCRVIAQSPTTSRILPQRVYDSLQPVADYLFCRSGLADPGGMMQTSTLLAPRELLLAVPFREGLLMHQDWDWVIRVSSFEGVNLIMLPRPLIIWRVEDGRLSVGRISNWEYSLAWIRELRSFVSPHAFSSFVAIQCVWRAKKSHAGLAARMRILFAFLLEGRPGWRSSAHFLVFSVVPEPLRRWLRDAVRARRDPADAAPGLCLAFSRTPNPRTLHRTSR
jgi:glycosyltransferase involved in cell wall biosynthesis